MLLKRAGLSFVYIMEADSAKGGFSSYDENTNNKEEVYMSSVDVNLKISPSDMIFEVPKEQVFIKNRRASILEKIEFPQICIVGSLRGQGLPFVAVAIAENGDMKAQYKLGCLFLARIINLMVSFAQR